MLCKQAKTCSERCHRSRNQLEHLFLYQQGLVDLWRKVLSGGDSPRPWRGPEWQRSSSKTWRISTRSEKFWGGECPSQAFRSSAGQELLRDSSLPSGSTCVRVWFRSALRGRNAAAAAGLFVLETGSAEGVRAGTERWTHLPEYSQFSRPGPGRSWWWLTVGKVMVQSCYSSHVEETWEGKHCEGSCWGVMWFLRKLQINF